jgi:spermidine/putrescine transport system permease protein
MASGFSVRKQTGFTAIASLCFVLLYLPIFVLMLYSFNAGTSIAKWEGLSWRWYVTAWNNQKVIESSLRSLTIAGFAAVVSTIVATMAALATTRKKEFRGQTAVYAFINIPLMVPEIVTGVALLIFFASIKIATGYDGLGYLLVSHAAFCIPFAYLPIRARLETMDLSLERAAADLYATPWRVFRHITFPLLWPAIIAGAMLAFVTSLDTVVITELVKSAGQDTLPTYMLGEIRRQITPEMNAISTVFLMISVVAVTVVFLLSRSSRIN